jgi:transcriptional regulator with XRE-family HTH domain
MDMPIGKTIRALRKRAGLSQFALAERMGCARAFINKAERDVHSPLLDTVDRFAAGLDIETWRLIRYAQKMQRQMESTEEAQA